MVLRKEDIEMLEKQKKEIIEQLNLYDAAVKNGDSDKAWKCLAILLNKNNKGLKIVNKVMPELKKSLEKRNFKLKNQKKILKEKELVEKQKSIPRMIVIPKQQRIN